MALTLLLRCRSIDETRSFYRSVLGFDVSDSAEGTLTVHRHGATLVFTAQDLWGAEAGLTGTIYFTVADVDACHAELDGRTPFAWPLQQMPYGSREFGLRDCNGYLLAFTQHR